MVCSRCGVSSDNTFDHVDTVNNLGFVLCSTCLVQSIHVWHTNRLNYFHETENWGNPNFMDIKLLYLLDTAREAIGKPFIIHENGAYATEGHSPTGYHPKGQAVDGHFEGVSLYDTYDKLKCWWPGGLGVYPYWNKPGFHFDVGPKRRFTVDGSGCVTILSNNI